MSIARLTSKDNPVLKSIRLVSSQSRRAPPDLVLVEGIRILREAIDAGCAIPIAVLSERCGAGHDEQRLLAALSEMRTRLYRAPDALFRATSGVQAPQGALALASVPRDHLPAAPGAGIPLILCACQIQDPGNLGTLIRTSAAAGTSMVCCTTDTVSARNPKSIRASAGAFFRLPVVEGLSPTEFAAYCNQQKIRLYRADARAKLVYLKADLVRPCAILVGNEGQGIAETDWPDAQAISIPMATGVESLNVAVAGAILLFEARRQRRYQGQNPGFLRPTSGR